MNFLFALILAFAVANSADESNKPCLGTDTVQAGGGGALVGYAVGSHDLAALTRAVPLVGGGLLLRKAFSSEESKTGCKVVAAVAGALVGHRNSYKDADPNSAAGSSGGGGGGDPPPVPELE